MRLDNRSIRRRKGVGLGLLMLVTVFIALSAAGLVWPRADGPEVVVVDFDVGARPAAGSDAMIAVAINSLLDHPTTVALITGHTGADGDAQANLALSRSRADVVAKALADAGVPADRIISRGAGGAAPPDPREGESAASLSKRTRRAEVRIVERRLLGALGDG